MTEKTKDLTFFTLKIGIGTICLIELLKFIMINY